MPKYYVMSGDLKRIVIADDALEACDKALMKAQGETIGDYFYVDERGFRNDAYNDSTPDLSPTYSVQRKYVFNTQGKDEFFEEYDPNNLDEDWLDDADFDA